ncbi:isochorismatase family protein [Dermacoccus nishinomiyaensis]|nr:isochorismatase family protein [Dermacoccus nishinomiyaensis]
MSETALLVVDVQNDVMAESVNSDDVVAKISSLVDRAREQGVPVIWVQHSDPGMPRDSDAWQVVPQLVPAPGELVVHKTWVMRSSRPTSPNVCRSATSNASSSAAPRPTPASARRSTAASTAATT